VQLALRGPDEGDFSPGPSGRGRACGVDAASAGRQLWFPAMLPVVQISLDRTDIEEALAPESDLCSAATWNRDPHLALKS
jgi:hypothetical protein